MTTGAADQPEIRPVKPQGRLLPADNAVLDKWVLRVNTANATLEFTEDRAFIITSPRTVVFPLPSSGQADAVHTLCLVNYGWRKNIMSGTTWRPLFLDGGGRVVGKGRTRDQPRASELWPIRIFEPLRELGITVTERSFGTEKEYKHAYPGA